jgi:hypothetical protein
MKGVNRMKNILAFSKNRSLFFSSIITLFFLLALQGCVKRTVIDNRIYSSYPEVQIVVDKEFQYLGSGVYTTRAGDAFRENAFFYFISKKNKSQTIEKGVLIETDDTKLDSTRWMYVPRIGNKVKNVVAHIGGGLVTITVIDNTSEPTQWLNKKGYMQPRCMLNYIIYKFGNFTSKYVTYFEDATLMGLSCDIAWDQNKTLGELDKEVKEFAKRGEKALTIEKFY